ncbi:MAG: hypothetical protein RMI74_08455 [Thermodesulfobacterium sp.]|nr:hypothetical protein [Thermodesulfobacterium sp.]
MKIKKSIPGEPLNEKGEKTQGKFGIKIQKSLKNLNSIKEASFKDS